VNFINVSGKKQRTPHNYYQKKCPSAEFIEFPLRFLVPSVCSQLDLALGTPEASGDVRSSEMGLSVGWCVELKKFSCTCGFLLP